MHHVELNPPSLFFPFFNLARILAKLWETGLSLSQDWETRSDSGIAAGIDIEVHATLAICYSMFSEIWMTNLKQRIYHPPYGRSFHGCKKR